MRKVASRAFWFALGFASALGALKLVEEFDEFDNMQSTSHR